jgi:hypothetical protein
LNNHPDLLTAYKRVFIGGAIWSEVPSQSENVLERPEIIRFLTIWRDVETELARLAEQAELQGELDLDGLTNLMIKGVLSVREYDTLVSARTLQDQIMKSDSSLSDGSLWRMVRELPFVVERLQSSRGHPGQPNESVPTNRPPE